MIFTVMENKQSVLFALNDFKKETPSEIPTILEQYLEFISKSGQTLFEWSHLRPLFVYKLDKISSEFYLDHPTDQYPPRPNTDNPSFNELKQRILKQIDNFQGTPFTIQRLCELLLNPRKYYKRPDKFLRGVERACMVVSTIDPYGNKIHSEDPRFSCPVGTLPINGSDNELWTFPNIHSANSNSPPLDNDNAAMAPSGHNVDSIQTVRSPNLVSNGNLSESSSATVPWVNTQLQAQLQVFENESGVHNFAPDEEDDYDDSSTDNEEGEICDQPMISQSPNHPSLESIQIESNNGGQSTSITKPSTNLSPDQLTVTVSIPAEVAGKLNDLTGTRSPTSSPTNASDLRPIGQLEAFVQNVSESGGFVERLNRSVSPGRCAFNISGERAISEEEDDIAASPAKKRRISPQTCSPPKLLSSPQSACTKEISIDSTESLPLSDTVKVSPTKSNIEPCEVEDSSKEEMPESDLLLQVKETAIDNQLAISGEGALDTAETPVVQLPDCHPEDIDQCESNTTTLLNDETKEPTDSLLETQCELPETSANAPDSNAENGSTFRDEESGEMDTSGFSSNQNRTQPVSIDLETGEQQ